MHSSTNNNKGTVLKLFEEAIIDYGGPSRIQTAKGGENTLIWELMVKIMGNERGSFLSSSSIHNQRIERLWRNLWNAVCCMFYYMLQAMEVQGKRKFKKPNVERVIPNFRISSFFLLFFPILYPYL